MADAKEQDNTPSVKMNIDCSANCKGNYGMVATLSLFSDQVDGLPKKMRARVEGKRCPFCGAPASYTTVK